MFFRKQKYLIKDTTTGLYIKNVAPSYTSLTDWYKDAKQLSKKDATALLLKLQSNLEFVKYKIVEL